ncbi:MAG: hypothetical protein GY801_40275 [bacterium]|nr:hypothetical protein [bacterium]
MDIDLVVDIQCKHVPLLVNMLEASYYIDRDMILEAIERRASCNLIHLESLLKIDVFILKSSSYDPLLEACANIKVTRLFLYMTEQHTHHWFSQLQPGNIKLGTGKRVIVKHGMLDTQHQITVPKYLDV